MIVGGLTTERLAAPRALPVASSIDLGSGAAMTHAISAIRRPAEALRAVAPAVFAMLLGAFILYGVGFAGPAALHNAAHDVRHAFTFPCH